MDKTPLSAKAQDEAWLEDLLALAIENRASDVHFEPARKDFFVRFRIDGLLYDAESPRAENQELVISKIKVAARLDTTERHVPQDGQFELNYKERLYDIRVSIFPTIFGEAAVLRILNREDILLDLSTLGFDQGQLALLNALIARPYGMILISGPSGSGKTTLLYSILNVLKKPTNNIVTIEDPVELHMEGVRQTQIAEKQGLDFAKALRSVLRQDADVIMVGEIRDNETAQMAAQAALTGRLIFSTFHTFNVFGMVSRLIEMGIPRSVVAHAIMGVVSTRLVRKICPFCKVSYTPDPKEERAFGKDFGPGQKFFKGNGCEKCFQSGYRGRTGVYEITPFDEEIRTQIVENPQIAALLPIISAKKGKTLKESAREKVREEITTLEEVARVIEG